MPGRLDPTKSKDCNALTTSTSETSTAGGTGVEGMEGVADCGCLESMVSYTSLE